MHSHSGGAGNFHVTIRFISVSVPQLLYLYSVPPILCSLSDPPYYSPDTSGVYENFLQMLQMNFFLAAVAGVPLHLVAS